EGVARGAIWIESSGRARRWRALEEDDMHAARAAEWIRGLDGHELGMGTQHHPDFDPEPLVDPRLEDPRDRSLRPGGAEHDIAALDVGAHVRMAEPGEQLSQFGHRLLARRADVDPSQQRCVRAGRGHGAVFWLL